MAGPLPLELNDKLTKDRKLEMEHAKNRYKRWSVGRWYSFGVSLTLGQARSDDGHPLGRLIVNVARESRRYLRLVWRNPNLGLGNAAGLDQSLRQEYHWLLLRF